MINSLASPSINKMLIWQKEAAASYKLETTPSKKAFVMNSIYFTMLYNLKIIAAACARVDSSWGANVPLPTPSIIPAF